MIVTLIASIIANPLTVTATLPNLPGEGITYVPLPAISLYETLRDTYNDGGSPLAFIANSIKNSGYLDPRIPGLEDLSALDDYILNKQPDLHGETEEETAYNVSDYIINNVSIDEDNNPDIKYLVLLHFLLDI